MFLLLKMVNSRLFQIITTHRVKQYKCRFDMKLVKFVKMTTCVDQEIMCVEKQESCYGCVTCPEKRDL